MFDKVSRKLKYDAVVLSASGIKETEVAQSQGIGLRTSQRAKQKLRNYGDIERGKQKTGLDMANRVERLEDRSTRSARTRSKPQFSCSNSN